jgi:CspA family cold shock protein
LYNKEENIVSTRVTGVVKWFNSAKGYGFIAPDAGGPDIFVHFSAIQLEGYKTLQEKERVSYISETGAKGPQASAVQKVNEVAHEGKSA